jgi:class 3 adenylate cyclase/HAMP domain-containing protein
MSIRWKFLSYILAIEIIIFAAFGYTIFEFLYEKHLQSFRSHILSIAQSTSSIIDTEKHRKIRMEESVENKDFQYYFSYMNNIFKREDYVSFFYTLDYDKDAKKFYYGISSETYPNNTIWLESKDIGFSINLINNEVSSFSHNKFLYDTSFEYSYNNKNFKVFKKIENEVTNIYINDSNILKLSCNEVCTELNKNITLQIAETWNASPELQSKFRNLRIMHYLKNSAPSPGGDYIDSEAEIDLLVNTLQKGEDYSAKEIRKSPWGEILTAYSIIRDKNSQPSGLVVIEVYGKEMQDLSNDFKKITILIFLIIISITLVVTYIFSNTIIKPILYLEKKLQEIGQGNYDVYVEMDRKDEFGRFAKTVNSMVADIKKSTEIQLKLNDKLNQTVNSYSNFVPHKFLQFLGKEEITQISLGDQIQRVMTILFSDIRSFTSLSEKMSPSETFQFINSYLHIMEPLARKHRGFIDKYIGDGIMAIYPEHAEDALLSAISMQSEVFSYNAYRKNEGQVPITIGVGIHTGNLILGIIGGEKRMDGTVISDSVNTASRLEGLTKIFGAGIIISDTSISTIKNKDQYALRYLGMIQVKGKEEYNKIYECMMSMNDVLLSKKIDLKKEFEIAVETFIEGDLKKSKSLFTKLQKLNPGDRAVLFYLSIISYYEKVGVPKEWHGTVEMDSK